ncbi:MAG: ROK family protein [Cyanobacteria bacterium SW_9_44_58]|nr:MAG: ROK family protein [Cyanobacteria bacterium SW_9_44_58]
MQQPTVLGIDLGGTAIKVGQFLVDGTCINYLTVPTPQPPHWEDVVERISTAVQQLDPEKRSCAIGIGTPGPTDASGRIALLAINLPGWRNVPLADLLEAKLKLPAIVGNDANCAGLGESWLGAGAHVNNLILLTLGTGVGGAIILNNELFTGPYGAAGELGLITLNPQGDPCNSGNHGSLEQHLCVQAIQRQTQKTPTELAELAQAGDKSALAFWEKYGQDLGAGLASLIYVLTPEAIIIGGGISASAEFFLPATWQEIEKRVVMNSRMKLQLLTAELGNQAGMVGAAKLAWEKMRTRNSHQN